MIQHTSAKALTQGDGPTPEQTLEPRKEFLFV